MNNPSKPDFDLNEFENIDLNFLKFYIAINCDGKEILKQIFFWGYRGLTNFKIKDYLSPDNSKKIFYNRERKQLEKCKTKEDINNFDITLLLKCLITPSLIIQNADFSVLDPLLSNIREIRNDLAHREFKNVNINEEFTKLKELLTSVAKHAGVAFGIDESEINNVKVVIETKLNATEEIGTLSAEEYRDEAICFVQHCRQILIDDGADELKNRYNNDNSTKMKILAWEVQEKAYDVSLFYTNLSLINTDKKTKVKDTRIFEIQDDCPQIYIVFSDSGTGKSTLLKAILHDWCCNTKKFRNLESFHLVFYMECRNYPGKDFDDFISSYLPSCFTKVKMSEFIYLKKYLLSLKILFLVDGIDEADQTTLSFVAEILSLNAPNAKFILTTRSSVLEETLSTIENKNKTTESIQIENFPVSKWMELSEKLLQVLQDPKNAHDSRDKIYIFLNSKSYPFWGLFSPFMITWLVILVVENPSALDSVTTTASVYDQIEKLMAEKVAVSIVNEDPNNFDSDKILQDFFPEFFSAISKVAFNSLINGTLRLNENEMDDVKSVCLRYFTKFSSSVSNVINNIISSFFNIQVCSSNSQTVKYYHFHHKSIQEFNAAKYIFRMISNSSKNETLRDLIDKGTLSSSSLSKMLIYTMEYFDASTQLPICQNIIDLAEEYGNPNDIDWLEFLSQHQLTDELSEFVASKISANGCLDLVIKDNKLLALKKLLKHLTPEKLYIYLMNLDHPPEETPGLFEIIEKISEKNVLLRLGFVYDFLNTNYSDCLIQPVLSSSSRCNLITFEGSLTVDIINILPTYIEKLILRMRLNEIRALSQQTSILANLKLLGKFLKVIVNEIRCHRSYMILKKQCFYI